MLKTMAGSGYTIFTSLHLQEEYEAIPDYPSNAATMCTWLKARGFKVIADISKRTFDYLNTDFPAMVDTLQLDAVRPDFGFDDEEILAMNEKVPVVLNATIVNQELIERLQGEVWALHNFYPRPETGLDETLFNSLNNRLNHLGVSTMAFIPGDDLKRGPIHEGLPTLEHHRSLPPYASFIELLHRYNVASVMIGDATLSDHQRQLIEATMHDGIIRIPVAFVSDYEYLYETTFTIRPDSPASLLRLKESRMYASAGETIEPCHTTTREAGAITIDNKRYKRYSGEIQIIKRDKPQDERVNVIGTVDEKYRGMLESLANGKKIRFIKL